MKSTKLYKYLFLMMSLNILYACSNYKDIPYFQNAEAFDGSKGAEVHDMTIKSKDKLTIFVSTPNSRDADVFNLREAEAFKNVKQNVVSYGYNLHNYLVDNEGNIDFPLIGKVKVAGMTLSQTNSYIEKLIKPYFKEGTNYIVNTRITNFEVSVMGEVAKPNTFTISRTQINVLEALAMAGDMTIYGKRDNVKVLRELPDGTYEAHELDMRDVNVLNSPYYNLQQRDIVYVEPNEVKAQNAKIGETTRLWIRGASVTISLGSLLYMVLE